MKIYDFRIEYREQPKGLAVKIPRFSWKIASGDNNVVQTAWHLIVSSAEKCFWDSGKIESDQSVLVPYAGQALTREQEYQVSLEIWDNYGNRAKAETAFTTGIFDTGDFQAKMITHDFPPEEMACPLQPVCHIIILILQNLMVICPAGCHVIIFYPFSVQGNFIDTKRRGVKAGR